MLRLIAGLSPITSGELRFDGERVNDWEPRRRDVAFVFQTYALYPHMTVRENIAFPLVMDAFKKWYHLPIVNWIAWRRLMKNSDIARRKESIALQLELDALLERRPVSLSGGQRQRVALARALIRNPSLYLLDEPLSNLDAKLRTQMRSEISALHRKVGKTFIYVTHDQVEAMTMATRIIVLDSGIVQQVDTPDGIYNEPARLLSVKVTSRSRTGQPGNTMAKCREPTITFLGFGRSHFCLVMTAADRFLRRSQSLSGSEPRRSSVADLYQTSLPLNAVCLSVI